MFVRFNRRVILWLAELLRFIFGSGALLNMAVKKGNSFRVVEFLSYGVKLDEVKKLYVLNR